MTDHTPGDWETVRMSPNHKGDNQMVCVRAVDSPLNSILAAIGTSNEDEANAKRIALCCNAHDDLLAACKWVTRGLEHHPMCRHRKNSISCNCAVGACQAAIAKAVTE